MAISQTNGSAITRTSTKNNGGLFLKGISNNNAPISTSKTVGSVFNPTYVVSGINNSAAISGGIFANDSKGIILRATSGLAGINNQFLINAASTNIPVPTLPITTTLSNFPSIKKNDRDYIYDKSTRTQKVATAIRQSKWNIYTGKFETSFPETSKDYWGLLNWKRIGKDYWELYADSISRTVATGIVNNVFHTYGSGIPGGFLGSVNLPDGRVFGIPNGRTNPYIFDPITNTYNVVSSITVTANDFGGGCLLKDGRVFLCPFNGTKALIYDPVTDTTKVPNGTYPGSSNNYFNCVLMEDGKVFMAPRRTPNPLIYDPIKDTLTTVIANSDVPSQPGCRGAVLLKNGLIFSAPYQGPSGYLYDPKNNIFKPSKAVFAIPSGSASNYSVVGGAILLKDGRVFLSPTSSPYKGYIYDPDTDSASPTIAFTGVAGGSTFNYVGGTLLPNGTVFCTPFNATQVAIYNPNTDSVSYIGSTPGNSAYNDATTMIDGRVICFPNSVSNISGALIYGGGSSFDKNIILSTYYNSVN